MKLSQRKKFGLPTAAQGQLRRTEDVRDESGSPSIAPEFAHRSNNRLGQQATFPSVQGGLGRAYACLERTC